MKELKIMLLLFIPFIGFGQNADKMAKAADYAAPAAVMENTFTARSVNAPQMSTFQKRGIQKLKDFYNYLTIISNPTYDKRLREDAKNQAKQLFYGPDCEVNGKVAMDFIDSCYNISKGIEWKALDVVILENMEAKTDITDSVEYHGELSFKESANSILSKTKKAQIIVSKSGKQFGNTKKEVWSVFICSIE
jgi:hypothetical protein